MAPPRTPPFQGDGAATDRGPPQFKLADFQTVSTLGQGSFGTVHKVVHITSGQTFAMKVLEKKKVIERELQEQLKREVVTQLKAKHKNIVRMIYYFEDKVEVSCLLEYADQGQLFAYLRRIKGGIPEPRAASFFADTASGLSYLHGIGVIHRDIKPENVLLFGEALTCKICDLGWCVELTIDRPVRKTFCGTMDYLAPEMLNNEPHDATVDLWALGVLLFEMLLGRAPFAGASPKDVADRICDCKLEIPADSMTDGPAEIIQGLLVQDKASRWSLDQVLQHVWLTSLGGSVDASGLDPVTMEATRQAVRRPASGDDSAIQQLACEELRAKLPESVTAALQAIRKPEQRPAPVATGPNLDTLAFEKTRRVGQKPAPAAASATGDELHCSSSSSSAPSPAPADSSVGRHSPRHRPEADRSLRDVEVDKTRMVGQAKNTKGTGGSCAEVDSRTAVDVDKTRMVGQAKNAKPTGGSRAEVDSRTAVEVDKTRIVPREKDVRKAEGTSAEVDARKLPQREGLSRAMLDITKIEKRVEAPSQEEPQLDIDVSLQDLDRKLGLKPTLVHGAAGDGVADLSPKSGDKSSKLKISRGHSPRPVNVLDATQASVHVVSDESDGEAPDWRRPPATLTTRRTVRDGRTPSDSGDSDIVAECLSMLDEVATAPGQKVEAMPSAPKMAQSPLMEVRLKPTPHGFLWEYVASIDTKDSLARSSSSSTSKASPWLPVPELNDAEFLSVVDDNTIELEELDDHLSLSLDGYRPPASLGNRGRPAARRPSPGITAFPGLLENGVRHNKPSALHAELERDPRYRPARRHGDESESSRPGRQHNGESAGRHDSRQDRQHSGGQERRQTGQDRPASDEDRRHSRELEQRLREIGRSGDGEELHGRVAASSAQGRSMQARSRTHAEGKSTQARSAPQRPDRILAAHKEQPPAAEDAGFFAGTAESVIEAGASVWGSLLNGMVALTTAPERTVGSPVAAAGAGSKNRRCGPG